MNIFKSLILSSIILSHTIATPLQALQTAHEYRKILDPDVAIDEILPPGVIPLAETENSSFFSQSTALKLAGSLALIYGAALASLLYLNYRTNTGALWSSWHAQESLENITLQKPLFAQELLRDIDHYYSKSVTAKVSSLSIFINDIEQEIVDLSRFLAWHRTIGKFKISFLFPAQLKAIAQAYIKIERLRFLKALVTQMA